MKLKIIIIVSLCLLWLALAQGVCLGATYYLDAELGDDSNLGTSEQPWQTLARAYDSNALTPNVEPGDTVYLRNGNYGKYTESLTASRSNWITYKAATGHTPVFTQINITSSVKRDAYLKFDGINIQHPNWTPATGDDGDYHALDTGAPGYLVYVNGANYVQFLGGKYEGYYLWISRGTYFENAGNITLKRCEITNFNGHAVNIDEHSSNFLVDNCYVHKMVNSSGFRILANVTGTILQNNHLNYESVGYEKTAPYFPHQHDESDPDWDGVTKNFLHNGSGISIRSSDITIRKNIVRGHFAQSIMFYLPVSNIVIENNLFYDTDEFQGWNTNGSVIVRNNTSIGYIRTPELTNKYKILQRYSGAALKFGLYGSFDGNGLEVYNNICLDYWQLPDPTDPNLLFEEDYNIFWRRFDNSNITKGAHSKLAIWLSDGALHGNPNYFEDIGYTGSTAEYNYATDGIQPFFADPNYYTGPVYSWGRNKIYNYHLAPGSPGINFGATQVATWQEVLSGAVTGPSQPPDSLGSLGPDGFIRDDGPARDATHHSVGAYEYISATPPIIYGDINGNGEVTSYDAALVARYAVGLEVFTDEQRQKADVTGNGAVSAYDAALIAQKAVGLIDRFPVE